MASIEPRNDDLEMGTDGTVAADESTKPGEPGRPTGDRSGRRLSSRVLGAADREGMLKQARDTDFPIGLRGYERAAVDRYVERVTRMITELEMSASPESAVRHALEEVSEETRDIL